MKNIILLNNCRYYLLLKKHREASPKIKPGNRGQSLDFKPTKNQSMNVNHLLQDKEDSRNEPKQKIDILNKSNDIGINNERKIKLTFIKYRKKTW